MPKPSQSSNRRMLPAEAVPIALRCLSCDNLLTFIRSFVGGVQPIERWDRYVCKRCGREFEYRLRTRKLKRAA